MKKFKISSVLKTTIHTLRYFLPKTKPNKNLKPSEDFVHRIPWEQKARDHYKGVRRTNENQNDIKKNIKFMNMHGIQDKKSALDSKKC